MLFLERLSKKGTIIYVSLTKAKATKFPYNALYLLSFHLFFLIQDPNHEMRQAI